MTSAKKPQMSRRIDVKTNDDGVVVAVGEISVPVGTPIVIWTEPTSPMADFNGRTGVFVGIESGPDIRRVGNALVRLDDGREIGLWGSEVYRIDLVDDIGRLDDR